jgi:hypothetical protein
MLTFEAVRITEASHTQPNRVDFAQTAQDWLEVSRLWTNTVEETKDRYGVEVRSPAMPQPTGSHIGEK